MTTRRDASPREPTAEVRDEKWWLARTARANVLVVCPDDAAERIVATLQAGLPPPVLSWRPGTRLGLGNAGHSGTVILWNIEALTPDDQSCLCEWLEIDAGRARVISTSREHVFPLVEAGTFLEMLYYRLNVLCFEFNAADVASLQVV